MKTIAIIGGGFSGTLTAFFLLQKSKNVTIKLINSDFPIAKGIAYSTISSEHLLNVPAGRMSAFPNLPQHFVQWLKSNNYSANELENAFVPRLLYGNYITELANSIKSNPHFEEMNAKAIDIDRVDNQYVVKLKTGTSLIADKIVLALGNFLPANPTISNPTFFNSKNYFQNPWDAAYLKNSANASAVLILGTGLTMVDCVLSLHANGFKGKIYALSPRGYTPASHTKNFTYPSFYNELKDLSLLEIVRLIRKHIQIANSKNDPWQAVIDSIRPYIQQIWLGLTKKEKQQFISHLRHIWGVARHRLPSETFNQIMDLKKSGQLEIIGGRVIGIDEKDSIIQVSVNLRKEKKIKELNVSNVINCTGPQANYNDLKDELIVNLLAKKMIIAHELKMGITTTLNGQVIEQQNNPSLDIFAIGSMLRGVLWETTAVPEIRTQAENVAQQISESIK